MHLDGREELKIVKLGRNGARRVPVSRMEINVFANYIFINTHVRIYFIIAIEIAFRSTLIIISVKLVSDSIRNASDLFGFYIFIYL